MVTTLQLGIALLAASLSHAKGDLPQDSLSRSYGPTTLRKRSQTLVDCLTNKTVPITAISDPSYVPFNRRLDYTPAVIVYPSTPQQVSDAVLCAGYTGIKVQPKSGGHSYASFSSGGQDGSLIIDLEPFQEINVDNSTGVAKVGGGVRLGNLALGIYAQGRRALPHGSCPGVGVGGHFTHGGYAFSSRAWGLALDTIVGMEVVLANGSHVHATANCYPEIYFALRGAADSFGVITTFYLQTLPAQNVVNFAFGIPSVYNSTKIGADALLHIQSYARNASVVDRKTGFSVRLNTTGAIIEGMYMGSLEEFNQKIRPEILRGLPGPIVSIVKELDWISGLQDLWPFPLRQPLTGYNEGGSFYGKSLITQESTPLTREAFESLFGFLITQGLNRNDTLYWYIIIALFGGPDSQINARPESSSAFPHRSGLWEFQFIGANVANGTYRPEWLDFVTGMSDAITKAQPDAEYDAYPNYVDPEYTADQAHELYYGRELYERLSALKTEVDPRETFWNPQAIRANRDYNYYDY